MVTSNVLASSNRKDILLGLRGLSGANRVAVRGQKHAVSGGRRKGYRRDLRKVGRLDGSVRPD